MVAAPPDGAYALIANHMRGSRRKGSATACQAYWPKSFTRSSDCWDYSMRYGR